ncbi:ATP-dependent RNA helicase [Coemansia aciculifera]|uniref:ATP-dependent RNA helicase n=1 Tax=Coemansia aciculifera TaxID=417176 RepID=A0A9W8IU76_9FUNG|nr:ATP-dependent RNA helicase [Coemansia aciculifera]
MKKGKTAKSQASAKARREGARGNQTAPTEAEKQWTDITMNPPPMPMTRTLEATKNTIASAPSVAKRTSGSGAASAKPRKRAKTAKRDTTGVKANMDDESSLEWKSVALPTYIAGADDEIGGMLSLQEIDGVDCTWEDDEDTGGRILKFCNPQASKGDKKRSKAKPTADSDDEEEEEMDSFYDTVNWDDFVLVDEYSEDKAASGELVSIGERLRSAEANEASDMDTMDVLPAQADDDDEEDDVGYPVEDVEDPDLDVSAWEVYGVHADLLRALKHLGFSVPTEIQSKTLPQALAGRDIIGAAETGSGKTLAFGVPMLQHIAKRREKWTAPTGLILTPTRELAIQVKDHLKAMSRFVRARVVAIVGGMSLPKQERLLNSQPDIIVATPGRLWDMVSTNDVYLNQLRSIRFLAIDEADRMLEPGHFKELKFIFKAVNETPLQPREDKRQTFVFSATLLKDMQLNARKPSQKALKRNQGKPKPGSMEDLIERVGFQDKKPAYVDVTQSDATARTLVEARIDCLANEKDAYLYYFLVRYPGRTLVFVNSIDSIRRMLPMLRLLNVNVFGLHAQMEQRQRLKNVDRFRDTENAVLVASDVAARGLDIPRVDHVIHYQIPRSGDLYVHRSGRTARACQEGLAIMMVSPEERKLYYKMCEMLSKDISLFPVDLDLVGRLRPRVDLAREIDLKEHKMNKESHEKNWFKKNAEEMDIELDSDFMSSSDDEYGGKAPQTEKHQKQLVQSLKAKLSQMLAKQIMGRGISARYLSSGLISDLAERLTDTSNTNAVIPTLLKESALETAKVKIASKHRK